MHLSKQTCVMIMWNNHCEIVSVSRAMGNTNLAEKFGGQTQNGSVGGGVQETDDLDPSSPIVMIPQPMRASRGRGAEADSDDPDPAKGRNWWKYATIILALLLLVCISFLLVRVQTYSYI